MTTIFIVHGREGHPEENWFPWLKQELEKLGHAVYVPKFPTPKGQTLENWTKVLLQYKNEINNSIVIGHSLGVPFLLSILENHKIKSAFLVSGFIGTTGSRFDESMKTFAQKNFDFESIKRNCKKFYIFHSDNDPYVKLEKANELAVKLKTNVNLIKNAGHFNKASGYTKFEILLEKIKESMN